MKDVAAADVVVTRGAIDGSQRLTVWEASGIEAFMAVDAIQRTVGGFAEDGRIGKQRHTVPGILRTELRIVVAFEAGDGGGVLRFFHGRIGGQRHAQAQAAKYDEHPQDEFCRPPEGTCSRGCLP
jgi:hypothetical protein